ncbi:hypothetical protein G6F50_018499 [Rhizopus delemar]|uniref:Uncharacterized protein n=1 Tax=Rhizopus delemar TaxID=936053 RepID=A0A9P7BZ42_9FUNG|nr:hypothetical protein G6F50_018499 [Rhizopus delemar]
MDGDLLGDPLDQCLSFGHVLAQLALFDQLKLRVHLCTLQPFQLGRAPGPRTASPPSIQSLELSATRPPAAPRNARTI